MGGGGGGWVGGVVLKNLFWAGLWILLKFPPGLIPVFQSSASPSN